MKTKPNRTRALVELKPYRLEGWGATMSGRDRGKEIREKVAKLIDAAPADRVLPVDFSSVRYLDFSCADELFGKLLSRLAADLAGRYLVLTGLLPTARENVDAALKLRKLACVSRMSGGEAEVLGEPPPELLETWKLARDRGALTVKDLVKEFDIATNAASNRLAKLARLGLIAKVRTEGMESGGRVFVYECVR